MSDLRFELEMQSFRIEGRDLVWVTVNRGDRAAMPGEVVDVVKVYRRPAPVDVRWREEPEHVDPTPWQYDVPIDREVEPGTAHTARLSLTWGLEDGHYGAHLDIQKGAHGVEAEMFFVMQGGTPALDIG